MEALHFYILLLGVAWITFTRYFIPRIKNLPPTPLTAITILVHLLLKKPIHRILSEIATRHGPLLLLRFGVRRVLLVSSASVAEDLFTKHDVVFANRPKMVPGRTFGHNYTKLAWAPHCESWQRLRHISLHEVLRVQSPEDQHGALAAEVERLLGKLFGTKKKSVELKSVFQAFVCNLMIRMFAGKRYCIRKAKAEGDETKSMAEGDEKKSMAKGDDKDSIFSLLDYATRSFKLTTAEVDKEYFMPILKFLPFFDLEQRCNKLQSKGDALLDTMIEDIKKDGMSDDTAIRRLLDKQNDEPKDYSNEVIKGLVLELLSAGTDTSAGTIEWGLSLLLNHPEIMQRAQDEIEKCTGDRFLKPSDIKNLPYLRCIVKETMRLYPAAPLLVPHESLQECKVGGYNVPKNTMLLVNVWAIQNDPKIWDNPTEFNPERFMEILDEKDGFKSMPFGYGLRSCPGKDMTLSVIAFVLGSLIHCFDWETVQTDDRKMVDMTEQTDGKKMVDMTEQTHLALLKDEPLMAKCRPRSETMEARLSEMIKKYAD